MFCHKFGRRKNCLKLKITLKFIRKDCLKLKKIWLPIWFNLKERVSKICPFGTNLKASLAKKWAFCTVNLLLSRWHFLPEDYELKNSFTSSRTSERSIIKLPQTLGLFWSWKRSMGNHPIKKNSSRNSLWTLRMVDSSINFPSLGLFSSIAAYWLTICGHRWR